ncbi:MAG: riboflavin synthase [Dehalococcoidia bacterium]|nr:riboflavin synthase [Dehalococcoidia bacterium]
MFTGIVEELGEVVEATPTRMVIRAKVTLVGTRVGDSIAVNGACLTVVHLRDNTFAVDIAPETLRRTNLGDATPGASVNLERAMALGERMGGHMVQGHVEATGRVLSAEPEGQAVLMEFQAPPEIMRYVVPKGFIAVDGISLTVVQRRPSSFTVSVIPYTLANTVLASRGVGDRVNLETDIVARYVEQFVQGKA